MRIHTFQRVFASFLLVLLLDGLTKILAEKVLTLYTPIPVLGRVFRLTLSYNTGVAFGLFANGGVWPLVVTGFIIISLAAWLVGAIRSGEIPTTAGWPMGMILGGSVGNFADRLPDGRVTDFLDFGLGAARWPAFNLADSFIVMGFAILLWASLRSKTPNRVNDHEGHVEMKRPILVSILFVVLAFAASGCSLIPDLGRMGQLTVRDAWSRPANAGGNGAVYFVIDNATTHDDELLSASTEDAGAAEFHLSVMDPNGVMSMQPQTSVPVPAGQQVEFKPGELHLMLVGLKEDLAVGDRVPVTLQFKIAGKVTLEAQVREQ